VQNETAMKEGKSEEVCQLLIKPDYKNMLLKSKIIQFVHDFY